jgi:SAM-dependent methyltransferase
LSANAHIITDVLEPGNGRLLDLGGGAGILRDPLQRLGYDYTNVDISLSKTGGTDVVGDAHQLPFGNASFDVVVSKDTLEHFAQPWNVIPEVYRVLRPGGRFVIWVPFMHPFHATDYYRYTPLGLEYLTREFQTERFDAPLWLGTFVANIALSALHIVRVRSLDSVLRGMGGGLDRMLLRNGKRGRGFAAGYRMVLRRPQTEPAALATAEVP